MTRRRALWLRSAIGRPFAAAGMVAVATFTVVTAVLAPLLLRATEQAALRAAIGRAGTSSDIIVQVHSDDAQDARDSLIYGLSEIAQQAQPHGPWSAPLVTLRSLEPVRWRAGAAPTATTFTRSHLSATDAACHSLTLTAGRCPHGRAELAVPDDHAHAAMRVGDRIGIALHGTPAGAAPYVIVGRYDPAHPAAVSTEGDLSNGNSATDLVMAQSALVDLQTPINIRAADSLIVHELDLDTVPAAREGVKAVQDEVATTQLGVVSLDTALPDVLSTVATDRQAGAALVLVVTAQALAVSLLSAVGVMAVLSKVRTTEWALARLRGVRRRSWLAVVFTEPLALVVLGAALGAAVGWGLSLAVSESLTRTGSRLEFWRPPVLLAAGIALGGLVLAAAVASLRSARAPLASLLREASDPPQITRLALVGETLVYAFAAAATYQLLAVRSLVDTTSALALLAPGLLATALGLLAIRAAAVVVRRRGRRPARRVATLVVARPLARAPSRLQRQVVVAIGVALFVFATQLAALATRNQHLRAGALTGATTVLRVAVRPGVDLEAAVRAADPGGRTAMAAEELTSQVLSGTARVVAVDTTRFTRITTWRPGWAGLDSTQLRKELRPAGSAPIPLVGRSMSISVAGVLIATDPADVADPNAQPPQPLLTLIVADSAHGGAWRSVSFGALSDRRAVLRATLPCAGGCRLVRVQIDNATATPYKLRFRIASISTDRQQARVFVPALHTTSRWRPVLGTPEPGQEAQAGVFGESDGLHIGASPLTGDSISPAIAPTDAPDPLPALVARGSQANPSPGYAHAVQGNGLDGQPLLLRVAGRPDVLPRVGGEGVLLDLRTARRVSDPGQGSAVPQVWLAPGEHPDVERKLARHGIRVLGRDRLSTAEQALTRTAPARAARADLALAAVALVLVVIVLAVSRILDADRRRSLWLTARLSGVSRQRLRLLVAGEFGAPAAVAALIGTLAGLLTVALAGTRLPFFAAGSVGPPLDVAPDWTQAALVVGAVLMVIALAGVLCATVDASGARAEP